jgi:hypothetical protein
MFLMGAYGGLSIMEWMTMHPWCVTLTCAFFALRTVVASGSTRTLYLRLVGWGWGLGMGGFVGAGVCEGWEG